MRVDLRVKHDVEARKAAIGLFELGRGYKSAAIALSLPAEAVRRWQEIYRAFGSEVLLRMDGKQGRYTYEQKVAAASAAIRVDGDAVSAFHVEGRAIGHALDGDLLPRGFRDINGVDDASGGVEVIARTEEALPGIGELFSILAKA